MYEPPMEIDQTPIKKLTHIVYLSDGAFQCSWAKCVKIEESFFGVLISIKLCLPGIDKKRVENI